MLNCTSMSKKKKKNAEGEPEPRRTTPTFLLELPLQMYESQAKRIRAHLEAGRAFYNAVLSEGQQRLRQMRADPAWQVAACRSCLREQGMARAACHAGSARICLRRCWPSESTAL